MSNCILYSIPSCPKCSTIKSKLMMAGIEYESAQITEEEMKELGIELVPVLEIDENRLSFYESIKWIQERG